MQTTKRQTNKIVFPNIISSGGASELKYFRCLNRGGLVNNYSLVNSNVNGCFLVQYQSLTKLL